MKSLTAFTNRHVRIACTWCLLQAQTNFGRYTYLQHIPIFVEVLKLAFLDIIPRLLLPNYKLVKSSNSIDIYRDWHVITILVHFWPTSRVEDGRGSIKPRFPSPLIKPDIRSYRIRLSDWLLLKAYGGRHITLDTSRVHRLPLRLRPAVKLSLESLKLSGV